MIQDDTTSSTRRFKRSFRKTCGSAIQNKNCSSATRDDELDSSVGAEMKALISEQTKQRIVP